MQITGEQEILAARQKVWAALMDPDVLARCIDGVDTLDKTDEGFSGVMNAKVGPVRAKFKGAVTITESEEPSRYALSGEGKGGVAGFAKGSAEIDLAEAGADKTLLTYTANSQVGGKLAQLGARLVEGAAKGYAERFFENFRKEVEGPAETAETDAAAAAAQPAAAQAASQAAARAPAPAAAPLGTVDENEPFRTQSRGAGPIIWAGIVVVIAIGIVAAQFV